MSRNKLQEAEIEKEIKDYQRMQGILFDIYKDLERYLQKTDIIDKKGKLKNPQKLV